MTKDAKKLAEVVKSFRQIEFADLANEFRDEMEWERFNKAVDSMLSSRKVVMELLDVTTCIWIG